jgi:hypothetical protein
MVTAHRLIHIVIATTMLLAATSGALAQSVTTGSIAGEAKDATGAVLPGVTVEVASPALIEKVRTAVTDSSGAYKITDLRPGTYSVTFTLAGFAGVKREGINLTAGFTASINAEMRVGSIEETVVVSGQSPLVDVQIQPRGPHARYERYPDEQWSRTGRRWDRWGQLSGLDYPWRPTQRSTIHGRWHVSGLL